ncbi:MAG: hypothetical protein LC785_16655 [Acidobacteria bacterium]|nr:hypothetical protein [Acidobacteriota bacterium]MCA1643532.1 hypothetical protein [Acidobacteriota bacterium]
MGAEQEKVRSIAERVASRIGGGGDARDDVSPRDESGASSDEVAQLRASLREMQQRLARIESRAAGGDSRPSGEGASVSREGVGEGERAAPQPRPLLSSTYVPATHPSQERFGIDDAVAELVDFFESEKTCTVEPGGKPCDHCAMCSTRGF